MQSSPPVRAFSRRASQAESEYSLDLGALDLEDDDTDTNIPQQHIERIHSEDIDGPSDFTQNLDMWMRGGSMKKKKDTLRGTLKSASGLVQAIQEKGEDEKVEERRNLLPVPRADATGDEDDESHHTPENSPPKVSVLNEENTQYEEQFSSEWQTDGEGSTPQPPMHKQFLQPTVEDYYSELSPGRYASLHSRGRPFVSSNGTPRQLSERQEHQESTPGRASSPTLSPVRSPILQRTSTTGTRGRDMDDTARLEMETQLKQLASKCQQLENLNEALSQALDEERRVRQQEKQSHDSIAAAAKQREQDLIEMRNAASRHVRREFTQLKQRMDDQQKLVDMQHAGAQGNDLKHAAEVQQLKIQMDRQTMEHNMQLSALEQDLESARRGKNEAEQMTRDLRQEFEDERDVHDLELCKLREELKQAHEDESAMAAVERQLSEARNEIDQLKSTNAEAADQLKTASEELEAAQDAHDGEVSRTVTERSRAVELAAGFQRQLQDLRQQLREAQARHDAELSRLRASQEQNGQTSTQELEIVRNELEAKQTELNDAILERDDAQDSLEAIVSEKEALQKKLADMESVNVALDLRVTEAIRKREAQWREKLEEANKERELMSKALLHQWGRDEVGVENPQRYAYKYPAEKAEGKTPLRGASDGKENRRPDGKSKSVY